MTKCLNGELQIGDTVVSLPCEEYGGLIGVVTDIKPLGSPDRDTENETDDVYVDFENEYSSYRVEEILDDLRGLYDDPEKEWDDCALDMVIMSPDVLLKIDRAKINEREYRNLLLSEKRVANWCIKTLLQLFQPEQQE